MKRQAYGLLLIPILFLLVCPRFGWRMLSPDATSLTYSGTSHEAGVYSCRYEDGGESVEIRYDGPFSRDFTVVVNSAKIYSMTVGIDGCISTLEPDLPPFTISDIVWHDFYGIFFWRLIAVILTALGSFLLLRRKGLRNWALIVDTVSILIAARIIL